MKFYQYLNFKGIIFGFVLGVCFFILLIILSSCATLQEAGLTIKPPTIQDTAQTTGYVVAVTNPELAREFIKYTQVDREDILILYPSWKQYLAYRLKDPVHWRLVGTMFNLVSIDLQCKTNKEQEEIIRNLFRKFISGLQAGIDAHN